MSVQTPDDGDYGPWSLTIPGELPLMRREKGGKADRAIDCVSGSIYIGAAKTSLRVTA